MESTIQKVSVLSSDSPILASSSELFDRKLSTRGTEKVCQVTSLLRMAQGKAKRLLKELADLTKSPCPGWTVSTVDDDIYHWTGTVAGPAGTPYEGGSFKVDLKLPVEYPMKAPEVKFLTKIYHPNFDKEGRCCLQLLKDWAPSVTMSKVLLQISDLMAKPNAASAVEGDIGLQFMNERAKFDEEARKWTRQYAH